MTPIVVTIDQAAEIMNVHPNTVRAMLPRLGAVDFNQGRKGKRLIRIPIKNIEAYIRDSVIVPPRRQERRRA